MSESESKETKTQNDKSTKSEHIEYKRLCLIDITSTQSAICI